MDSLFEQVWEKFLSQDISVSTSIETNNNRIKRRDIDTLTTLILKGDKDKAKDLLVELFLSTPTWNPLAVTTMLQKTAEYLNSCGQYEDAILFAERGLQWDPAHPELIALLCRINHTVDPQRSLYYYNFFKETGYSDSLLSDYTASGESNSENCYHPKFDPLHAMSNESLFRLMVYQAAAFCRRPLFESIDSLRTHALACLAGGCLHMARVALRLVLFRLKDPLYISGLNPSSIQIKTKWVRVIEKMVSEGIESENKSKNNLQEMQITERLCDRKNVIEELMIKKNTQGLFCFVMDPVPEISFHACQYLIEAGEEQMVAQYIAVASRVAMENKDVYGEMKPQLMMRLLKDPDSISISESPKQSQTKETRLKNVEETEPEEVAVVKKIVRRKIASKEKEIPDTKKIVVKKVKKKV